MKRLNHEDRTHLRRTVMDYQSRPQSDVPPTKAPDFERPDPALIGLALLSEQLHETETVTTVDELDEIRERYGASLVASELITERFVKKLPPPAVVCHFCGSALCKDTKDRWVHVYSGLCTRAVPA